MYELWCLKFGPRSCEAQPSFTAQRVRGSGWVSILLNRNLKAPGYHWTKTLTSFFLTQQPGTTVEVWSKALWELFLLSLVTFSKPLGVLLGTPGHTRSRLNATLLKWIFEVKGSQNINKSWFKEFAFIFQFLKNPRNTDDTAWLHFMKKKMLQRY